MTCALREVEAGRRHQPDQSTGSIESVGCGLQPFIINDLELVSREGIELLDEQFRNQHYTQMKSVWVDLNI